MHSPRSHGAFLEETGLGCSIYQKIFQHSLHYQSAWQYLQQLSEIMPAQSWVTSGPRLLQHLLFLLTVLDEPSAAKATLFGLVFLLLFFEEWGQEIHQQSYTALDKSTDGQYSVISWCKRLLEKNQGKLLLRVSIKSCSRTVRAEQSSCRDMLFSKAHFTPAEVNCISAMQRDKNPLSLPSLGLHSKKKGRKHDWEAGSLTGFLILSCTFPA